MIPGLGRSPGEGNGNPFQNSCLKNPRDRGTWQATLHGIAKAGHDLATTPPPPPPPGRGVINTVKSDGSSQRPFLSFTLLLQVTHQRLFLAPSHSRHSRPCSQKNHNSGLILQEQSAGMKKSHTVTSLKQAPHFILMKKI